MPRIAKDKKVENDKIDEKKVVVKKKASAKSTSNSKKAETVKKTATKKTEPVEKAASKKSTAKKVSTTKKEPVKKASVAKKVDTEVIKKTPTRKSSLSKIIESVENEIIEDTVKKAKSTTTKKKTETKTAKKTAEPKTAVTKKKVETKTTSTKKKTEAEKNPAKKKAQSTKTTTSAKKATKTTAVKEKGSAKKSTKTTAVKEKAPAKKRASKKTTNTPVIQIAEYYDLPLKYGNTVVKLLAQTPKTLFVYWEVSDSDIDNFKKQYGEDFFNKTKPYLIVHNLTLDKKTEIEINDFANSWYLNTEDTDCKFDIELVRKFINNSNEDSEDNSDYLYIAKSNTLTSPNNHILFEKIQEFVVFRDANNDNVIKKNIKSFKFLKDIYKFYKDMYDEEVLNNPSSQFNFQ